MSAEQVNIDTVMQQALHAGEAYQKFTYGARAAFLHGIADGIEALGEMLLLEAAKETHLTLPRLVSERNRTVTQLRLFADMVVDGCWLEASIDTAIPDRNPPRPDIRKMMHPLGPIVVFGASNFPFAYSTAGGDTASALAAGCAVVVKAHPAHLQTSKLVAKVIEEAILLHGMPTHLFQHVTDTSFETGRALVVHPATAAVGFTGSFKGGKALYDYAVARPRPIPVFAEMGSVNPVMIMPLALKEQAPTIAQQYAASITLGMGQFCTNPGILLLSEGSGLDTFLQVISTAIRTIAPAPMLHQGIYDAYVERSAIALNIPGVELLERSQEDASHMSSIPMIAKVSGVTFLQNPQLHEEIFGPFSLIVICSDTAQQREVWASLQGQLTTTIIATELDLQEHDWLHVMAPAMAGRVIFNGVPTGVEVCGSMMHGGPFPATTDSRFTAVGGDAVKRWLRPVTYQNCPDRFLPAALQEGNPLGVWRRVNNEWMC